MKTILEHRRELARIKLGIPDLEMPCYNCADTTIEMENQWGDLKACEVCCTLYTEVELMAMDLKEANV